MTSRWLSVIKCCFVSVVCERVSFESCEWNWKTSKYYIVHGITYHSFAVRNSVTWHLSVCLVPLCGINNPYRRFDCSTYLIITYFLDKISYRLWSFLYCFYKFSLFSFFVYQLVLYSVGLGKMLPDHRRPRSVLNSFTYSFICIFLGLHCGRMYLAERWVQAWRGSVSLCESNRHFLSTLFLFYLLTASVNDEVTWCLSVLECVVC